MVGTNRQRVIETCRCTIVTPKVITGVYGGFLDKFPFGAAFSKGLTFKMGQTNVHKYLRPLLKLIKDGKIDPSFVITHRLALKDAASGYSTFKNDKDDCIRHYLVLRNDTNRCGRSLGRTRSEPITAAVRRAFVCSGCWTVVGLAGPAPWQAPQSAR